MIFRLTLTAFAVLSIVMLCVLAVPHQPEVKGTVKVGISQIPSPKNVPKRIFSCCIQDCSVCYADLKSDELCLHPSWAHVIPCIRGLIHTYPDCKHCLCDLEQIFKPNITCSEKTFNNFLS